MFYNVQRQVLSVLSLDAMSPTFHNLCDVWIQPGNMHNHINDFFDMDQHSNEMNGDIIVLIKEIGHEKT